MIRVLCVSSFSFCSCIADTSFIMNFSQNIRGGRVKLHSIINPPSEFEHVEKGDALYGKKDCLFIPSPWLFVII